VVRADKEGNFEPLRQALLKQTGYDLDRFLRKKPAGRKRGQHYPIVKKKDPVTEAAIDAKIIWWLWKRKYPKRPTGVNAKQIAADRHKVSVDEVINKSKKISFEIIPSAWATLGPRKHLNATQLKIECFTVSTDGRKIQSWWDADF